MTRPFFDRYAAGQWFQVPNDFLIAFGAGPGDLFATMVNTDWLSRGGGAVDHEEREVKLARYKKKGGWVLLPRKTIKGKLGINDQRQKRLLAAFVKLGVIQLKMMGNPAKRHFRLVEEVAGPFIENKCTPGVKSVPPKGVRIGTGSLKDIDAKDKDLPAAVGGRGDTEDNTMPLDGVNVPANSRSKLPAQIQEVDRLRAQTLKDALAAKRIGVARGWSKNSWSAEFAALRAAHPEFDTDRLLAWYCKSLGHPYVPQAHSAKSFRLKFDQLVSAFARHERDNPTVTVSEDSLKVFDRVAHLRWPKGAGTDLQVAIQLVLDAYTDLTKRLSKTAASAGESSRLGRLARHVIDATPQYATFAEQWVRELHKQATHFGDKWKGGVLKRAPRSRLDPVFVDLVNGAAQKYGSDQSVIDNLWEEIK